MARRKKRILVRKKIEANPSVFICLNCGEKTLKINSEKKTENYIIECSNCRTKKEFRTEDKTKIEPVDIYGNYIDSFYSNQEFDRLNKEIPKLQKEEKWEELIHTCLILMEICECRNYDGTVDDFRRNEYKNQKTFFENLKNECILNLKIERKIYDTKPNIIFPSIKPEGKEFRKKKSVFEDEGFLEF